MKSNQTSISSEASPTRDPHHRKRGQRRLSVFFGRFHFLDLLLEQFLGAQPHWICRPVLQLEEARQQCLAEFLGCLCAMVSSSQDAGAGWKLHTSWQQRWQMVDCDVRQWRVRKFVELYRWAVEISRLVAEWDRVIGIRRITWRIQ